MLSFNQYKTTSFIYLFIYLFIYSFIHLFIYSFVHLFIYSFIHLFIYSFIHLFIYSFIHLFIYSFIHLFIYSFIHLFIYSFIHLFIYSFIHLFRGSLNVDFWDNCLFFTQSEKKFHLFFNIMFSKIPMKTEFNGTESMLCILHTLRYKTENT